MSKKIDSGEFVDRLRKAANHAKVEFSQQAIATFLQGGFTRQKVDAWFNGSLPRADRIFDVAERFGVDAKWLATGHGDMVPGAYATPELPASEALLLEHYRAADPRWRLSLQFLAALATEDQLEAATDVNMVIARISGMKPRGLRPVGDARMREILRSSPQGWPPRPTAKKENER